MKRKRNRAAPGGAAPSGHRLTRHRKVLLFAALGAAIFAAGAIAIRRPPGADRGRTPIASPRPVFVGSRACATCHAAEFQSWQGSHHQLAMQPATDATVAGDFAQVKFIDAGVTSTFFRAGGKFMVRTDGPDGAPHDYQIKYTFGVSPLQQYLIEFPGGRLQAFTVAWDNRPRAGGGQHWFALYPGTAGQPSNPLHWTAIDQNWNYMCADCHSTNVRKNYASATRTYATTYAEIDVGCEACHGPGSAHLAWARQPGDRRELDSGHGLTIALDESRGVSWQIEPHSGDLHRSPPPASHRELEMCARCHSRRAQIHEDYVHGQPLGDDYRAALLDEGLYFPDGQIEGEVYEYGSFIQSRMFHAGVTCGDCHDPHSAQPRAIGNTLCTRCHLAQKYDTPHHYFHSAGSAGSRCVECHMPARTYMLVDPRRDHSLRVPRPDLSVILGTPNACNNCHTGQSAQWAAEQLAKWYGPARIGFQQFAPDLRAGRLGAPGARDKLAQLAVNSGQPAIARATALAALAGAPDTPGDELLRASSTDPSSLVRRASAALLASAPPETDASAMSRLLGDPVRAVRIQAAQSLAGVAPRDLPDQVAGALAHASVEYLNAQRLNADRPEAHFNLGLFFAKEREFGRAESELRTALAIDPSFSPAAVNLADLFRAAGRDEHAQAVLQEALRHAPGDASLLFALGLLKVRQKQTAQALDLLAAAARLDPSNPRYAYVYAIALNDAGATTAAIDTLERSVKLNPYQPDSLAALVSLCDRAGQHAKALRYARLLNELSAQGQPAGSADQTGTR